MNTGIKIFYPALFVLFCLHFALTSSSEEHKKKRVVIHVPIKVKEHKHIHTIVKNIHHHHKPIIVKEEKIIKQEIHKPIQIEEEVKHEHFHHHYSHEHPSLEIKEPLGGYETESKPDHLHGHI